MSNEENGATPENELEVLKQRANTMNISFHPNIGVEKLRAKVNGVLSGDEETETDVAEAAAFDAELAQRSIKQKKTNQLPLTEAVAKRESTEVWE